MHGVFQRQGPQEAQLLKLTDRRVSEYITNIHIIRLDWANGNSRIRPCDSTQNCDEKNAKHYTTIVTAANAEEGQSMAPLQRSLREAQRNEAQPNRNIISILLLLNSSFNMSEDAVGREASHDQEG